MKWLRKRSSTVHEISPDEIFLDSTNLPELESSQFEGRVVRPVSKKSVITIGIVFALIICTFSSRAYYLQVAHGATYDDISRNNIFEKSLVFATRGIIYDRTGQELAWNVPQESASSTALSASTTPYALRKYSSLAGLSHLLGFLQYPKADASGAWWRTTYAGMSGVELAFNENLQGKNGSQMTETNARGALQRQGIVVDPQPGENLTLSINADIQSKLYQLLSVHAQEQGFQGGAAVIMDVRSGQLIALTSFPEYNNQAFTDSDQQVITDTSKSSSKPLLNRAIAGLYAPGSIVKPIFAAAALNEGIISPDKQIDSIGAITLPNPYDPAHPSVFHDWTVHGWIDMRTAIAVSSDEYFYTVGGGYGDQKGLGITAIDKYAKLFGLGSTTGIALLGEQDGLVPSPAWKADVFGASDPWRIGDTYHTAIGQYGFQITPIQAVRYIAAIANGGKLLTPQILSNSAVAYTNIGIPDADLQVVREGMRLGVTSNRSDAIEKFLNLSGIQIAGKTGTAQIGTHNQWVNSWAVGFWPADKPKYAYAVVLEQAPAGTLSGAAPGLLPFFQWLIANHPEYVN